MTISISVKDWDPTVDQQISAQAQAMYESTLARKHGLRREDFRDANGMRLDAKLREFTGIPFGMVRGVQQRTQYMIPGTSIPTHKAQLASIERLKDQEHSLQTRQNYEETLGSVRKAFYRVTKQPDMTSKYLFYVWPMPPGVHTPLVFKSQEQAVAEAQRLSLSADPRLTNIWWNPLKTHNSKKNSALPNRAPAALSGRHGSGRAGGYTAAERDALPSSDFLKPETRGWPVSDYRHAEIALQYMAWGRGNRSEYPKLLRRLFELYPPSKYPQLLEKAKKYNLGQLVYNTAVPHKLNGVHMFRMRHNPDDMGHAQEIEGAVIVARFPGTCAKCHKPFIPRVTEIKDSGMRGPKGGKKMVHADPSECV